jgi:hypothetical protein
MNFVLLSKIFPRVQKVVVQLFLAGQFIFAAGLSHAHETGMTSMHVMLENDRASRLEIEMDVLDAELAIGIDADADGIILWREFIQRMPAMTGYIQQHLEIAMDANPCRLSLIPSESGIRSTEPAAVFMAFTVHCDQAGSALVINNSLLLAVDSSARALMSVTGGKVDASASLGHGSFEMDLDAENTWLTTMTFVWQGVYHILIGFDHIAFLLILLLPVAREGKLRSRVLTIAGIVTAFTLAHSVTLTLAAFSRLQLPPAPVEIVIAGSIVFAALINIAMPGHRVGWLMAYVFGLIHGFGFASVLADLDIGNNLRLANLLAFNLGVELGQLALIAVAIPVCAVLGNRLQYRRYVLPSVSVLIASAGVYWMITRVMDVVPLTG